MVLDKKSLKYISFPLISFFFFFGEKIEKGHRRKVMQLLFKKVMSIGKKNLNIFIIQLNRFFLFFFQPNKLLATCFYH